MKLRIGADAYRVSFPGFTVVPVSPFPGGLTDQPDGFNPAGPGDRYEGFDQGGSPPYTTPN